MQEHVPRISLSTFSEALLSLKKDRNWTWRDMAARSGRSVGYISSLCTQTARPSIKKATAEDILRRLNGENLPPTPRQQAEYKRKMSRLQREDRFLTKRERTVEEKNAQITALSLRLGKNPQ